MAAMKRISILASISRIVEGGAFASNATGHRFLQPALYSTQDHSLKKSHWLFRPSLVDHGLCQFSGSFPNGTSGAAFFSASSLAEEVNTQRSSPSENFAPKDVVLYQYEACPFCNKVKAFLDYHGIAYKIVEVNPMSKKEIKWSDYKKVPVLLVDGEQMNDSSAIIDNLFKKIHQEEDGALQNEEERKWRGWVDNHLVHVLSPNIYRSASEALESFDYITTHGNFSFSERIIAKYGGAAAMYFVSKKLKKRHNITDERKALYDAAETWVEALNDRQFLGGAKPNLADLSVYGVLRPIRYLTSGKDMVENTRIGEWYARMERLVKKSAHHPL
ncbi:prostaglandin E synthase 2-like [Impatiens glandulifera]|uniref:prostaglandin E synthase 2-like n=1 Tax=Impatiens glandulifera TaxID=253017 RepID=UPI001FB04FB3|nr:prostaglandin E synthase 2-like [Impatiens glandulifera]